MKGKTSLFYIKIVLLVFLFSACVFDIWADIYKYVDKNGVVHLTNMPTTRDYSIALKEKGDSERERRAAGCLQTCWED